MRMRWYHVHTAPCTSDTFFKLPSFTATVLVKLLEVLDALLRRSELAILTFLRLLNCQRKHSTSHL
jgi:hypothetical protein